MYTRKKSGYVVVLKVALPVDLVLGDFIYYFLYLALFFSNTMLKAVTSVIGHR